MFVSSRTALARFAAACALGGSLAALLIVKRRRDLRRAASGAVEAKKKPSETTPSLDDKRVPRVKSTGGRHLEIHEITILEHTKEYLIFDKPYDCRLDGESEEPTVERAARFAEPTLEKIRFCNQLDYATSGIMVLACNKQFAREAGKCFEDRNSIKHYLAVGHGHCVQEGAFVLNGAIAVVEGDFRMALVNAQPPGGYGHHGGPASTIAICVGRGHMQSNGRQLPASVFLLRPLTGRRHQLRLHLASVAGHPIVGDATYSEMDQDERCAERMMLHAWRLELPLYQKRRKGRTLSFVTPEPFSQYLPGDWPQKLPQALELVSLMASSC